VAPVAGFNGAELFAARCVRGSAPVLALEGLVRERRNLVRE